MGAGTAKAGPSTTTLPTTQASLQKLSRSRTFEVESDADLAEFMGSVKHSTLDNPAEPDHISLALFMKQARWVKYRCWPKEQSAVMAIDLLPNWPHLCSSRNLDEVQLCETPEGNIKTILSSYFFMFAHCVGTFNVLLKLTQNTQDESLVDIELHIRSQNNDIEALKTQDALKSEYVQMYWANGGVPMIVVNNEYVWTHTAEGGVDSTISTLAVPATFDIVPCIGPSQPFALTLFDYQLRTLAWMQGIEDREPSLFYAPNLFPVEDGAGDMWFDATSKTFLKVDVEAQQSRNVTSGIIADKPGVGKTITTLALCHSRPFKDTDFLYSLHNYMFRSKATLILVPNNIADQWEQEIRKCLGDSVSVIQMKGKANYTNTTLQDILTCDFVIVSYSFLVNGAYRGASKIGRSLLNNNKKLDLKNSAADRQKFVTSSKRGTFAFTWCHFHRIVCDELHEVFEKQNAIKDQVLQLSGDCLWGLTGTPTFTSIDVICRYADFLNLKATVFPKREMFRCIQNQWVIPKLEVFRFIQNRVRRNEPDVTYPPPVFETFSCRQTPIERAFYQSCIHSGVVNLLKLCNHYQIGREGANLGAHAAMSIEKVTQMVQKNRVSEMADLDDRITRMEEEGEELRITLDESDVKRAANTKAAETKINTIKLKVAEMRVNRASIQAQFNFFENFVNTYLSKGGQKIECNVCLEEDVQGEIGIVPCGHSFCGDCADAISTQGKCPSCRDVFQLREVMKVLPPPAAEPVNETVNGQESDAKDGSNNLDPNMFGSKIREVVKYIKEESIKSDDYRFIVFIQYSDLADLVSDALKTYGLSTAQVRYGWQQREKALRLFRAGISKPGADVVKVSETVQADTSEQVLYPFDPMGKGKRVAEEHPEAVSKAAKKAKRNKPAQKPVKVLILSAHDSVSGLNLTEASHCIILHPFVSGREENAIASEQQGIARVLRKGQEKTVTIVRFYVEGTVEQAMHEARVLALDAAR
ncbi:SNF2 family N-terminal domain-containing protein [Chytriomyces cf. hyalinus JEL632]|nr:SNF2 family N-terminal domain-containing protein [Chytriomyces cf. hyalinus JEL632]